MDLRAPQFMDNSSVIEIMLREIMPDVRVTFNKDDNSYVIEGTFVNDGPKVFNFFGLTLPTQDSN